MADLRTLTSRWRPSPSADRGRIDDAAGRKNMRQLVALRWIAVAGQIVTIAAVHTGLHIALPVRPMLLVLTGLALFNAASLLRLRLAREVANAELFVAMLVDVAALTGQLYLSGGAANPFLFLYLLQVSIAAILLPPLWSWAVLAATLGCMALVALFARPLALAPPSAVNPLGLYLLGMAVCFVLDAVLLVVFITRTSHNLRVRDANLAAMQQRAAEEEHIVRMGLLATGAAHELGSPLATMDVILGDWRRVPALAHDAELLEEIREMQAQVQRCKAIVTGILLSAGEARGEAPAVTTVRAFLDQLALDWRASRAITHFDYRNLFGEDQPMVADSALQQTLCNVLDNALEASPDWVGLHARRDGDDLLVEIRDAGPGFNAAMLARLGAPYQSSKGRPGSGLGLFLVVNVVRTLGGSIEAENLPTGGARVGLRLPLAAFALQNGKPPSRPRHAS